MPNGTKINKGWGQTNTGLTPETNKYDKMPTTCHQSPKQSTLIIQSQKQKTYNILNVKKASCKHVEKESFWSFMAWTKLKKQACNITKPTCIWKPETAVSNKQCPTGQKQVTAGIHSLHRIYPVNKLKTGKRTNIHSTTEWYCWKKKNKL